MKTSPTICVKSFLLRLDKWKEVLNSVKQIGFVSVSRRLERPFAMKKDLLQFVLNRSYGSKDEHSNDSNVEERLE